MTQKVYISSAKKVTFTCPQCEHPMVVDVARNEKLKTVDRVRVTCRRCKHRYRVAIERRGHYRKMVDLSGFYTKLFDGLPILKGRLKVIDLSRTGVKIMLADHPAVAVGDRLLIEFHLDDAHRTMIRKEVEVKTMYGQELGVAFTSVHPSDPSDKALGFYMFG